MDRAGWVSVSFGYYGLLYLFWELEDTSHVVHHVHLKMLDDACAIIWTTSFILHYLQCQSEHLRGLSVYLDHR